MVFLLWSGHIRKKMTEFAGLLSSPHINLQSTICDQELTPDCLHRINQGSLTLNPRWGGVNVWRLRNKVCLLVPHFKGAMCNKIWKSKDNLWHGLFFWLISLPVRSCFVWEILLCSWISSLSFHLCWLFRSCKWSKIRFNILEQRQYLRSLCLMSKLMTLHYVNLMCKVVTRV